MISTMTGGRLQSRTPIILKAYKPRTKQNHRLMGRILDIRCDCYSVSSPFVLSFHLSAFVVSVIAISVRLENGASKAWMTAGYGTALDLSRLDGQYDQPQKCKKGWRWVVEWADEVFMTV